jgi:hypothetical protein
MSQGIPISIRYFFIAFCFCCFSRFFFGVHCFSCPWQVSQGWQ